MFEREVESDLEFPDADLIIASDGINSKIRDRYADVFKPDLVVRPNRYIWLGTQKLFDAFTFDFRKHRARLVPGAYLQVRPRHLDLHRRDDGGGLRGAWPRQARPERLDRILREAVRRDAGRRRADDQCAPPARLGLAQLQPADLRRLEPFQRQVACRADGRRRPYRAFRHRLGHQARLRRRDRTRQPVRRASATAARHIAARAGSLRGGPPRRRRAHPERRAQRDGMVRGGRPPLRRHARAGAVLLFHADALAAHQPREPAPARPATGSRATSAGSRAAPGVAVEGRRARRRRRC